jgi:hypothetical protein
MISEIVSGLGYWQDVELHFKDSNPYGQILEVNIRCSHRWITSLRIFGI